MKNLHIDFETFSSVDIDLGSYKYSESYDAEVLMASWCIDEEVPNLWVNTLNWPERHPSIRDFVFSPAPPPELVEYLNDSNVLIWAHNVSFEKAIIDNVLRRNYPQINKVDNRRYRCTAALTRSLALHGDLEGAAIDLKLLEQKDKRGELLINKFSKKRNPTDKKPRVRYFGWEDDHWPDFLNYCEYCVQDVRTERAIHSRLKDYELTGVELEVFLLDLVMNERGLYIDVEAVSKGLDILDDYKRQQISQCRKLTGGIDPTRTAMLLSTVNDMLPPRIEKLRNLQATTIDNFLTENVDLKEVNPCYEILKIRRSLSRSSTSKLQKMYDAPCKDKRVKGTLLYHAATTGRWAGRIIQPQNLPRPTLPNSFELLDSSMYMDSNDLDFLYGDPMRVISSVIRHYITAPEGKELMVVDFTAIEARVLAWMAGQLDALENYQKEVDAKKSYTEGAITFDQYKKIKTDCDVYIKMAAEVYQKDASKVTKNERSLGKAIVLGCGYQMWWPTFIKSCAKVGLQIDNSLAEKSVRIYRQNYSRVVQLWDDVNNAAVRAVNRPDEIQTVGKIGYLKKDDFLFAILPSGRKLAYPYPKIVRGKRGLAVEFYGKGDDSVYWCRRTLYGGKLTQHATQGIGRDLIANGMLNAEKEGYEVITSVHDECLSEVHEGFGNLTRFEYSLCEQPSWANGIPLTAEGYRSKRYKKG
jgi:DNA polymerase